MAGKASPLRTEASGSSANLTIVELHEGRRDVRQRTPAGSGANQGERAKSPARRQRICAVAGGILLLTLVGAAVGIVLGTRAASDDSRSRERGTVTSDTAFGPAQAASGPTGQGSTAAPGFLPQGTSGEWEVLPPLPIPLGEVAACLLHVNRTIDGVRETYYYHVVVGEHPSDVAAADKGVTLMYEFATQRWLRGAERPFFAHHETAEVHGNMLYLIGGFGAEAKVQIGQLFETSDGAVEVRWSLGSDIPFSTASASSWLVGDQIHVCGGIVGPSTRTDCATYDIPSDTWTQTMPHLPLGRNHAAACLGDDELYLFGGRAGGNVVGLGFGETQVFVGGDWQQRAPLHDRRGGMGKAVWRDGRCYVFGGEIAEADLEAGLEAHGKISSGNTYHGVDVYDIASDSWSEGPDMPAGLHGIFPVSAGDAICIAGGGDKVANSQTDSHFCLHL